ncbi:MAG: hypothetical protein JW815_04200 [Candidatus Bathyarchaeota archaeon]|nr:hypothetical protein [Candidatus Bathyarchaeum sp.]
MLQNLKNILKSVDLNLTDVIKTSVFLSDLKDFQNFNMV